MSGMSGRLSGCLAAACFVLAIGAVRAQTAASAPPQRAAPKSATPTPHKGSIASPGKPAVAEAPPNLREAMAKMLEADLGFRTYLDGGAPKLLDTGFVGPIQRSTDLFRPSETIYCVSAKLDIFPFPTQRVALLKVVTGQDGKVVIGARIGLTNTPFACRLVKYGPFPELDAARRKRREALGKPN
jgi:hypothetical protein